MASKKYTAWKTSVFKYLDLNKNPERVSPERTALEINRSFVIKNIPFEISLINLYDEFSVFGIVKDLCVTSRRRND